ncbi:hypothetical protein QL285_005403 [Trifolium repens]|nr:hypothetical protein QL285_005403 [Trifolium repens]
MAGSGTISLTDEHKIKRHNVGDDDNMNDMITDLPEKDMSNFLLDLVGRLISKSNRIERLGITIYNTTVDADKVGSLISSASNHKIQSLRLSLGDQNNEFVLPHSFSAFESLSELCLGLTFTLHIPTGICFPSLKKLDVSDVTFANEDSVQQLFSGCPILQELELYNCDWKNIQQINVAISTLRKLRIAFDILCVDYDHDMTVKIDAVNLISLKCTCNPTIEFIPVNLTSLVDACIHLGYVYPHSEPYAAQCVIELLRGLSSVKSLKIFNNSLECLSHAKDTLHLLPSFHNLTHLCVYSWSPEKTNGVLLDILQKTPKLEVLTIPGAVLNYLDGEDVILNSVPYCFKSSLNRLSILNFYGDDYEIQFLKFILNSSPFLGDIEIHCSRYLSADMEKMTNVWNQLEDVDVETCVIKFLYSYYSSDDEDDEYEAANSGVLPAAEPL